MDAEHNDALKRFEEADWPQMTLKLLKYSLFKARRLEWSTGDFLPKGMHAEDLALEAIRKTCEGLVSNKTGKGIRIWNPEKNPDLLDHLKSVVDSDIHALVESMEHRLTNYSARCSPDDASTMTELMIENSGLMIETRSLSAEERLTQRETIIERERSLSALIGQLYEVCQDNEEELLVLEAYQEAAKSAEKIKPSLIARYAGLDEKTTRNAMRRIARHIDRTRERLSEK